MWRSIREQVAVLVERHQANRNVPCERTLLELQLPIGGLLQSIPQGGLARHYAHNRAVLLPIHHDVGVGQVTTVLPVVDQQIALDSIKWRLRVPFLQVRVARAGQPQSVSTVQPLHFVLNHEPHQFLQGAPTKRLGRIAILRLQLLERRNDLGQVISRVPVFPLKEQLKNLVLVFERSRFGVGHRNRIQPGFGSVNRTRCPACRVAAGDLYRPGD